MEGLACLQRGLGQSHVGLFSFLVKRLWNKNSQVIEGRDHVDFVNSSIPQISDSCGNMLEAQSVCEM
jgi:hypothetical protein